MRRIYYLAPMLVSLFLGIHLFGFLHLPSFASPFSPRINFTGIDEFVGTRTKDRFSDLLEAFSQWDAAVGCGEFQSKFRHWTSEFNASRSLQEPGLDCDASTPRQVSVVVKQWTWIPDELDGIYPCRCRLSCVWTKSAAMADNPDALLYESSTPPEKRYKGDPLRVFLELEASRKRSGFEDIFVGYHANDDIQVTYAGKLFHIGRSYHLSTQKRTDILVYWSSSRCLLERNRLARNFLKMVPHHSFGKCLNNVGGPDMSLSLYPECSRGGNKTPHWSDHLHCAMSHYKFVLAIENTMTESYVTEKLFYALEAGAVPIYFGAPNVLDLLPPHSIIDGSRFQSLEKLASYIKALAEDPVGYAQYHAWRRCGVIGNYGRTRENSIDTLPCRLCELVSRKGGKNARAGT